MLTLVAYETVPMFGIDSLRARVRVDIGNF